MLSKSDQSCQNCKNDNGNRYSDRTCDSSEVDHHDNIDLRQKRVTFNDRSELFASIIQGQQLSPKIHHRAVSWMITICWSKDFSQECLWSTLLLYYAYRSIKVFKKDQLQLILLSCLSLSLKLNSCKGYSTKDVSALSTKGVSVSDIVDMETVILEILDYNVIVPHQIQELYLRDDLDENELQKILLLSELLMIKDHSIFWDKTKMGVLIAIVTGQRIDRQGQVFVCLQELMKRKECRIILSKYSSKMDLNEFQTIFE